MGKQGLESIRTTKLATLTSVLDAYLVPIFTSANAKPQLVTVANLNAGGVLDSNNEWSGTNTFLDTVSIGKSGTAGDIKIYPSTASKGYLAITIDDQTGNTAVELNVNAMGQGTVVNLDDPGAAASHLVQSTAQITLAEADVLDGATAGTVVASKALVVDGSSNLSGIATLGVTNLDAGASGTAGSVDVFPTTASKGKFTLACTDQTGDTAVTLNANAMGQATTVNISDPGAAASYLVQSTAALTLAEVDVLDAVTPGTATASKALVVDGSVDVAGINALSATTLNGTTINAGASGTAGTLNAYPTTASKGKLSLSCTDQTGDTTVTINANAMGQATTVNIADPGAAASYLAQSTAALTLAEMDVLDGATAGTAVASKVLVVDGSSNVAGIATFGATDIDAGASGTAGSIDIFPTTASKGKTSITSTDNTGDTTTAIVIGAQADARTYTVPDAGQSTANFVLDQDRTDFVKFMGLNDVIAFSAGTWTTTRVAQGDYVSRKTAADDTTIIGIDITEVLRTTASKGLKLTSFDVIFRNTTADLDAHTVTLDKIAYTDSAVVTTTNIALTGALGVGQDADPQIDNVTIDTPAFNVTDDSKYVMELTVDAAAGSVYDFIGVMLKFTRNDL